MYGKSWDQGSDASTESQTEPAFCPSPHPVNRGSRSRVSKKGNPIAKRGSSKEQQVPEAGAMLLAVYETDEEYRAGILLVEAVLETAASDCDTGNRGAKGSGSPPRKWLGRVVELQLDHEHQPGEALQWGEAIELSSDKILYLQVLACQLKSDHVAACHRVVSRLRSIARMLDMSRGGDESNLDDP